MDNSELFIVHETVKTQNFYQIILLIAILTYKDDEQMSQSGP